MADVNRIIDIRGFLIDLDGVLYTGIRSVPGAKETLRILDKNGYPYRFISNSTRRCRMSIAKKLRDLGFVIEPSSIITPAMAAAKHLREREKRSCILLSTGDVHLDFEVEGISMDDPHADTVVIADAGDNFTYARMNEAFRRVLGGAELMALEKDRFWMGSDGLMLSAGPFVAALEFATGRESSLIGKPAREFFLRGAEELGLDPGVIAMVGDDLQSDVGGSHRAGMRGILVRTGKYREEDLRNSSVVPDLVIDSIASLPSSLQIGDRLRPT
ncbi:MAG: TIGR01458 family HAD-type hydrolase [Methanomicrobiales archaeon]|nr:TIGR01458 family HAD-type hydrolase [Methanomicrobiales archaeon]